VQNDAQNQDAVKLRQGCKAGSADTFVCCALPNILIDLQNEVEYEDAVKLVGKGVTLVLEGANMPTTNDGINFLHSKGCVLAPAKACNAGAAC
jgi:glutamate dehydrogenase/leucine dehydrogenase